MNRDQIKEVFKILAYAYPKFEVSSEKIDFWHKFLADQNPAIVMKKVEKYVMTHTFPPTIAELREEKKKEETHVLAPFWGMEIYE